MNRPPEDPAEDGEWVPPPDDWVANDNRSTQAPQRPSEPRIGPIASAWGSLGDLEALTTEPPPRTWLLRRPDDETGGMTSTGVLQLGKVGLLVAQGGAGKTYALVELALAIATGRKWLDYFTVATPGRVLFLLGEEDADELKRRFYGVGRAMCLTDDQITAAHANIVALPLAGAHVALLEKDGVTPTHAYYELRDQVMASEWSLIVLDPLSRFAGADTEKDSSSATRFVQLAEALSKAPGTPTVLLAHHTNKLSRAEGSKANAANARGSTALTDGVRWVAELESAGDEGARLTVVKSNYGRLGQPVDLVRCDGRLRAATPDEIRRKAQAKEGEREQEEEIKLASLCALILEWLAEHPDQSRTAIANAIPGRRALLFRAVQGLIDAGEIVPSSKQGFSVAAKGAST